MSYEKVYSLATLLVDLGRFALSTGGLVAHPRPSIDVLFESAAGAYDEGTIGVVKEDRVIDPLLGRH